VETPRRTIILQLHLLLPSNSNIRRGEKKINIEDYQTKQNKTNKNREKTKKKLQQKNNNEKSQWH